MDTDPVIRDGLMRKKGRVNMWGERYFVLRGSGLYYYIKAADKVTQNAQVLIVKNNNDHSYLITRNPKGYSNWKKHAKFLRFAQT